MTTKITPEDLKLIADNVYPSRFIEIYKGTVLMSDPEGRIVFNPLQNKAQSWDIADKLSNLRKEPAVVKGDITGNFKKMAQDSRDWQYDLAMIFTDDSPQRQLVLTARNYLTVKGEASGEAQS